MRRRLTAAIVAVVTGALVIAGLGTYLLVRRSARDETRRDLVRQANVVARLAEGRLQRQQALNVIKQAARLEDGAEVRLTASGALLDPMPAGVRARDVDAIALLQGDTVSGSRGALVFAAVPISLPPERAIAGTTGRRAAGSAGAGAVRSGGVAVAAIVLTRPVRGVQRGLGYLLATSGIALLVAAVVAEYLGRRIARPLRKAEDATRRIAAGELSTRVPVAPDEYPELASLTRSINSMAASLSRSRGLERQFLMSVSHDLRTPLTSIRGFAEAISDGAATDVDRAALVIASEARRLERLVRDLLELAQLDARRFSLDVRPVDAGEVVADAAEGFRPATDEAGLELTVAVPDRDRVPVLADPDRLAQIVANLVENAFKFAHERIHVAVTAKAGGDGDGAAKAVVEVTVGDDGVGIAADDLPHVFERLYQSARAPARQMGSGLGLAIVAELTHAMGGSIRAESPAGPAGGTRMVLSLRTPSSSSSAAAASSSSSPTPPSR